MPNEARDILYRKAATLVVLVLLVIAAATYSWNHYSLYTNRTGLRLPNGRLLGADFLSFYIAGKTFAEDRSNLYNWEQQHAVQQEFIAGQGVSEGGLPFVYPPLVAAGFSLLAVLPYAEAFSLWFFLSLFLVILSLFLLARSLALSTRNIALALLLVLAFSPFTVECLAGGQTSAIGVFILSAFFLARQANRDFLAGIVLAFSYYKPPLFLGFVLLLLLRKEFRVLVGFGAFGVVLVGSSVALVGVQGFLDYCAQAMSYRLGNELLIGMQLPLEKAVGLYAFFQALLEDKQTLSTSCYLLAFAVLLFERLRTPPKSSNCARPGQALFPLLFAGDVIFSLLVSPQMAIYDVSLLLPVIVIVLGTRPSVWRAFDVLLFACGTLLLSCEFLFRTYAMLGVEIRVTTLVLLLLYFSVRRITVRCSTTALVP